jgi:hypothetical protein
MNASPEQEIDGSDQVSTIFSDIPEIGKYKKYLGCVECIGYPGIKNREIPRALGLKSAIVEPESPSISGSYQLNFTLNSPCLSRKNVLCWW